MISNTAAVCTTARLCFLEVFPFNHDRIVASHRRWVETSADKSFYSVMGWTLREKESESYRLHWYHPYKDCLGVGGDGCGPSSNYVPGKSSGWTGKTWEWWKRGGRESRVEKFSAERRSKSRARNHTTFAIIISWIVYRRVSLRRRSMRNAYAPSEFTLVKVNQRECRRETTILGFSV